jgi:hypothetical protein
MLWKYGERTSRFGKRWQKRYFVLLKDKLFYYKSAVRRHPPTALTDSLTETIAFTGGSNDEQSHKARGEALSFIGIQRVRAIVQTEPFDSFSRKSPDCCFQALSPHPPSLSFSRARLVLHSLIMRSSHVWRTPLQIETSSGDVHHLIAENQQQQTEWVSLVVSSCLHLILTHS